MFDGRKETLRQQEKYTNPWWKVERGEKRGAITGERHSYRIWAQISLIITACTATYVLHRLSRTRSYLPVPTLKDTSPCGVRPVSLMTMMDDYDCNFRGNAPLAITPAKWSGQFICVLPTMVLSEIKRREINSCEFWISGNWRTFILEEDIVDFCEISLIQLFSRYDDLWW